MLVVHLGIPLESRAEALLLPKLLLIPKPLAWYPMGLPGSFAESRQKRLYVKIDKVFNESILIL